MTILKNNGEGGTSGTAITTTNSSASGDAFTLVNAPSGGVVAWSNAQAAHGSLSIKFTPAASQACQAGWNFAATAGFASRVYVWLDALPTTTFTVAQAMLGNGATTTCRWGITETGRLQFIDGGGGLAYWPTNAVFTFNTGAWYRVEMYVAKGTTTTNGTLKIAVYLGDSTTALASYSTTAGNAGTASFTDFRFGKPAASGAVASLYLDDIAVDTAATDFIGVPPSSIPPADTVAVASVISNAGGWLAVNAGDIPSAVADHNDTSKYAETPAAPVNAKMVNRLAPLTAAPETVTVWAAAPGAPSTIALRLLQGATQITTLAATALTTGVVPYQMTLDATARAAVTDPTTLDVEITGNQT